MVVYKKGDALESKQTILVHQVNCLGVMGSGIAKSIRYKWPEVYNLYQDYCYGVKVKESLLGSCQFCFTDDNNVVVNLFSQVDYMPRNMCHTDYAAMQTGLKELKAAFPSIDIAMPRIGCGLGGGDWEVVSNIIEEIFDDRTVFVYDLE